MTFLINLKKYKHYIILVLSILIYFETERQIEYYQTNIKDLDQTQKSLVHKINQEKSMKLSREKIVTQYQQAQQSGLIAFYDPNNFALELEQVCEASRLNELQYQIKQTEKKQLKNVTLYWTKIILEIAHQQDQEIFQFIRTLEHKIPGFLVAEQLSLTRADASSSGKNLNSEVSGFYHFYLITFDPDVISTS